jgi:hypothetical protein
VTHGTCPLALSQKCGRPVYLIFYPVHARTRYRYPVEWPHFCKLQGPAHRAKPCVVPPLAPYEEASYWVTFTCTDDARM